MNPIVASLVLVATGRARANIPQAAREQVEIHQTRQFAMRWLEVADNGRSTSASEACDSGQISVCDNSSRRRGHRSSPGAAAQDEQPLRVGLVGRDSRFGLGHQNRDIAAHLGIDRWLVPRFDGDVDLEAKGPPCRVDVVSRELSPLELEAWLDGLDVVLFVERPVFSILPAVARRCGVRVACVPNWEWLHPGLEWLDDVDLMLCPTRHTAGLLGRWKSQFRFGWEVEYLPWPVDTVRFRHRQRWFCRKFVFVHGSGGAPAVCRDPSSTGLHRKGLAVLLAAARLAPEIRIVVYAFPADVPAPPPNVDVRLPPADNTALYRDGDVCILPSHWEGLGLPLLECQAAGMPLITTDAPPMNEHRPVAVIPAREEAVNLAPQICIPAARIQPEDLARALRSVHGRLIFRASRRARRFVERDHNWRIAGPRILRRLAALVLASDCQVRN